MIKMNVILALVLICVCSCTTIHFDNGSSNSKSTIKEQWHHNVAFALYEASDPVNLKEECGLGEWKSVKTELSFINAFASGFVNFLLPAWYPKTVEISCSEKT